MTVISDVKADITYQLSGDVNRDIAGQQASPKPSTRTAAATEARRSAGFVRRAVAVADQIEKLPDAMLKELALVIVEELDRRDDTKEGDRP